MVTTKASSCGWNVPSLSSSEKPKVGVTPTLAFLDAQLPSSELRPITTDITLEQVPASPLGLANIILIMPNASRRAPSL